MTFEDEFHNHRGSEKNPNIEKAISMNFNEEPDTNTYASFRKYALTALNGLMDFIWLLFFGIVNIQLIIWSIIAFSPLSFFLSLSLPHTYHGDKNTYYTLFGY